MLIVHNYLETSCWLFRIIYNLMFIVQNYIKLVQGSKDVVEFLVMNSTVVDVGGKRDTKKVMMMIIVMTIMMIIMKIKMTLDRQWFWYILTLKLINQVIVHFVRQSGSYITSCFIPTAMLGLLAYSTFFIHIDDFNDRLGGGINDDV